MNPFTESTVASPLPPAAASDFSRRLRRRPALRRRKWLGAALGMLAVTPSSAVAIDLNTATAAQLLALRGIGPRTAQIIIDERKRAGPYESLQDLSDRVRGIGPRKVAALKASGLKVERRYMTLRPPAQGDSMPAASAPQGARATSANR